VYRVIIAWVTETGKIKQYTDHTYHFSSTDKDDDCSHMLGAATIS
jgi:hypothetical protein